MTARWNGQPCDVKVIRIVMNGTEDNPVLFWGKAFYGMERQALLVTQGSSQFVIDNEDGTGWLKVTVGMGSPSYGHRSIFGYTIVSTGEKPKQYNASEQRELHRVADEYLKARYPEEFEKSLRLRKAAEEIGKLRTI